MKLKDFCDSKTENDELNGRIRNTFRMKDEGQDRTGQDRGSSCEK